MHFDSVVIPSWSNYRDAGEMRGAAGEMDGSEPDCFFTKQTDARV